MLTMWLRTGSLVNRRAISGAKAALFSRTMSSSGKLDLTGVYPPIPTPFKQDESIDWDALRSNLTLWNAHDLRGYLVQGSNGEYCYLTLQERVDMIRVVKESAGKNMLVLAGSGCESTRQTIDLTCKMAEAGADARLGQMHKWRRRTSSTLNSPMEVVHLAVGLADIVANVARETRAVGPTMRAAGLSAREAAAENIILCASSGR